jgi:hypothetical protein
LVVNTNLKLITQLQDFTKNHLVALNNPQWLFIAALDEPIPLMTTNQREKPHIALFVGDCP